MNNPVYLDYNATCPPKPEVLSAMNDVMAQPHNASAVHQTGRAGNALIENAREQVAALVNAPSTQVIFNSGATEGNNTVIRHFGDEPILVSAIEHDAVLKAKDDLITIPVNTDGLVDLEALKNLLAEHKPALVSVMLANNETGTIQPVKQIADLAHSAGALFHCDAVQAAGRIEIDMPAMGIDFLTLSAHKFGGPQGVGALVLGLCGVTPTLLHGGGQEKSARAGTENVAGIVGFGKAAELAKRDLDSFTQKTSSHQKTLEDALGGYDGVHIYGQNAPRVGNTTLFSIEGLSSETLLMAFDLDGIALSNGSACSSGKVEPSHVLKAMGASDEAASGALRISTGWNTSEEDIEAILNVWQKLYQRMKDKIKAHA